AEAQADVREGVNPDLLKRERWLQKELDTKAELQMQLLKGRYSKEKGEALAVEIEAITADYQKVQALIRSQSPRYAALTPTKPLRLKEVHEQVLDEESLLLEYALGDDNSYLWAVTKTGMTSYTLPKRAEIEKLARPVYELLTARQPKLHESPQQYHLRVKEA